jgi:hypothetical protein
MENLWTKASPSIYKCQNHTQKSLLPQGQRVFVEKVFIAKAYFFATAFVATF